tara:strand:+ start:932 stop:1333 length:402 start_codon:yes stop_codon:yes gene_type:complete
MWEVLFLLSAFVYFFCEAVTEADTWDSDQGVKRIEEGSYHLFRLGESLGLFFCCFMLGAGLLGTTWFWTLASTITLGFYLYERVFSDIRHDDPFFERPWPFKIGGMELPNPPVELQHAAAGIAGVTMLVLIFT